MLQWFTSIVYHSYQTLQEKLVSSTTNEINSMDHNLTGTIKETLKEKPFIKSGFEPLQWGDGDGFEMEGEEGDGSVSYRFLTK